MNSRERREERKDDDVRSLRSVRSEASNYNNPGGLHSVFRHLTKPIAVTLDKDNRDNPEKVVRATDHLNKITEGYVGKALQNDTVIQLQTYKLDMLTAKIEKMSLELLAVKRDGQTAAKALTEKTNAITPNPEWTYPTDEASQDMYVKSVQAMQLAVKSIERSYTFKTHPNEFLLEVCSCSNGIASNFGLTKQQQQTLILNLIPSTSTIYGDIGMCKSLENIFRWASMTSSSIFTRSELEALIENWKFDFSTPQTLNDSISQLKSYFVHKANASLENVDQKNLFNEMWTRVRREKLPTFVYRAIDEGRIRLDMETDEVSMHQTFLATFKPLIGSKQQKSHQLALPDFHQEQSTKSSPPNHQQGGQSKQTGAKQKDKQKGRGREGKVKFENKKEDKSRSKSKGKFKFIEPWPLNKPYLSKNGNSLSHACNEHFMKCCFKCGMNNHLAKNCRIYEGSKVTLSLCEQCRRGFHDVCKSFKFKDKGQTQNDSGNFDMAVSKRVQHILENYDVAPKNYGYSAPPPGAGFYYQNQGPPVMGPVPPLPIKNISPRVDTDDED
jgi:hypothetical protein